MRDADRRKLILLAEARATTVAATALIRQLVEDLERLQGSSAIDAPARVARDLWSSLIDIRECISREISEVPS